MDAEKRKKVRLRSPRVLLAPRSGGRPHEGTCQQEL